MVFWPPCPWYFDPPYPWYIDPPTHGISTSLPMVYRPPLPMVYRIPYPWYFDPPTYGISNPLLWYYESLSFGRNEGGQFTMRGFKIQWQKIDPRVKIPYDILTPGSKYHMKIDPGVKIPYDTGLWSLPRLFKWGLIGIEEILHMGPWVEAVFFIRPTKNRSDLSKNSTMDRILFFCRPRVGEIFYWNSPKDNEGNNDLQNTTQKAKRLGNMNSTKISVWTQVLWKYVL